MMNELMPIVTDKNMTSLDDMIQTIVDLQDDRFLKKHIYEIGYLETGDRYIELVQTRHDNKGGSNLIRRSNSHVLCDRINALYEVEHKPWTNSYFHMLGGIEWHTFESQSYVIRITGDLPTLVWAVILETVENWYEAEGFLLDQDNYDDMIYDDCWQFFVYHQYDSIVKSLKDKGVDTEAIEETAEADGDQSTWLWNFLMNSETNPYSDRIVMQTKYMAYYNLSDADMLNHLAVHYLKQQNKQEII